jgi:recombination protein RecA
MTKKGKSISFQDRMVERFGEQILDNHKIAVEAISTGSLSLNSAIGIGGIPRGMITELYGPEGSGKTTVALNTAKTLANKGGKALYIDVENLLNTELLKAVLGRDTVTDNITILTPDSAEDALMMLEEGIDSGEFELIILDSIGAMASRKEKEIEFDKDTMGVIPRLVGKFIKRNAYSIRTQNIAVLLVNQVRDNIGAYIKSVSPPGGHVLKHQAAVRISLNKGENLKRGEDIVGILVKFVIKKNKVAPPFRSFTLPIIFGEGIDFISDLIDFSKLMGVIQAAGAYYKFNGETLGQGKAATREKLKGSEELVNAIVEQVYGIVNKTHTISELLEDDEDLLDTERED